MIAQVRECGARVTLITDGDIAGLFTRLIPRPALIFIWERGAPEAFWLLPLCVAQVARCRVGWYSMAMTRKNVPAKWELPIYRKYKVDEMAKGDVVLFATGVTRVHAFGYIATKWCYLDRNPAHALVDRHHSLD